MREFAAHPLDGVAERLDPVGGRDGQSQLDGRTLEDEPEVVKVTDLVGRKRDNRVSAARTTDDQPVTAEDAQRLPDWRAAHAEALGQLFLHQTLARREIPGQQALAQDAHGFVGQRRNLKDLRCRCRRHHDLPFTHSMAGNLLSDRMLLV